MNKLYNELRVGHYSRKKTKSHHHFLMFLLFYSLIVIPGFGQSIKTEFSGFNTDGAINAMVKDETNGILYVGGKFTHIGDMHKYGAAADKSTAAVSSSYPAVNGRITYSISDGSGGFYIMGDFTEVDGLARERLAHINSSGTVTDLSLDVGGYYICMELVGSTLYLGGSFTQIDGVARSNIAAYDLVGGALTSWNPSVSSPVSAITSDGSTLYIGGSFTTVDGNTRTRVAAFDLSTGNLTSWDPEVNSTVRTMATDGTEVFIGGNFNTVEGTSTGTVASIYASTGALNTNWSFGVSSTIYSVLVDGGTLYIGGGYTSIAGQSRNRLASFDISTNSINTWNPNIGGSTISAMDIDGTTLYVGGYITTVGGASQNSVAAINTSTGALIDWNPGASGQVLTVAVSSNDVYIGGYVTAIGGQERTSLAAIDLSTGDVTSWAPSVNSSGSVYTLEFLGSSVYVGGSFTEINGTTRNNLGEVSSTTGTLSSWNPSPNSAVEDLLASVDYLYVSGAFSTIGGASQPYLASFDIATGTIDSWNPSPNGVVRELAFGTNTIYAAGSFSSIGGETRNKIAEINISDGLATSWDPNADGDIYTLAVAESGLVYVGGFFSNIGGNARSRIAAIDPSTGTSTTWNPSASSSLVGAIAVDAGKVYARGTFTTTTSAQTTDIGVIDEVTGEIEEWIVDVSIPYYAEILVDDLDVYLGGGGLYLTSGTLNGMAAFDRYPAAPYDISLSGNTINENTTKTIIGTFSSLDDSGDTHTYTLVSGTGDDDNDLFQIHEGSLAPNEGLDYETTPTASIRVRSTDQDGNYLEEVFSITINNVIETGNDITVFSLSAQTSAATIDAVNHTVSINVNPGTDVTGLTPIVKVSSGADYTPKTAQDFSSPVDYTVVAENGSSQVWTVTVTTSYDGLYTVGSGGDFATLGNALGSLGVSGMAGDIVFEVLDGYNEAQSISLSNPDPTYNITVRPESGATDIQFHPQSGYVFRLISNVSNFVMDGADPATGDIVFNVYSDGVGEEGVTISGILDDTDITFQNIRFDIANGDGISSGTGTSLVSGFNIYNCEFVATNVDASATIIGIYFRRSNLSGISVIGNKFYNEAGTIDPASFIAIAGVDDLDEVINNSISIRANLTLAISRALNVYHNSINIYGTGSESDGNHTAINYGGDVRNNIISITRSAGSSSTKYAITTSTSASVSVADTDNNIYITDDGVSSIVYAKNAITKSEMETLVPTTTFEEPLFTSEATADLSLSGANLTSPAFRGSDLSVTEDIEGTTRSTAVPALGAYEHANAIADIISFDGANVLSTTVDNVNNTVEFILSNGSSASFAPTIGLYAEAQGISPASGVTQDFSSPVVYTVTAADGTQDDWTVINKIPNTDANIESFSVTEQTGPAVIDIDNATVVIEVGRDVPNPFTPTMTISDGATITAGYDIGESITYGNSIADQTLTILSEDGLTSKEWTITMTLDPYAGGTYTVGTGDDFEDLEEAIIALDKYGYDGDVVLELQADYPVSTPPSTNMRLDWLSVNDGYSLTIQPADDVTSLNIDLGTRNMMFVSMKDFIIDGKDKLTFTTTYSGYALVITGESIVQNVSFDTEGSFLQSSSGVKSFQNCYFSYSGTSISSNEFFSISGGSSVTFEANTIDLGASYDDTDVSLFSVVYADVVLKNNVIMVDGVTLSTFKGLYALAGSSNQIEVYHNTFLVEGTASGTETITFFDISASTSTLATFKVENNLILLDRDPGAAGKLVGINYKNTTVKSYEGNHFFLHTGSHTRTYFEESGSTLYDNSNTADLFLAWPETSIGGVTFADAPNGDLHLSGGSLSNADLRTTNILAGITTDAEGTTRSTFASSKGAYEHPNNITTIGSFDVPNQSGDESIFGPTISIDVEAGTDVTSLQPTISVFPGATVSPASGATVDFTDPVAFTVTAEAGNTLVYTVTITELNGAPDDILITSTSIDENAGDNAAVGTLSTNDPNSSDSHTYSLVSGTGDSDNGQFDIDGDILRAISSFDYETKNSYSVRIQTSDGNGGIFSKSFTISVNDIAFEGITWDGSSWSNTVGPGAGTDDVLIAGDYSTATNGGISVNSIIINSGFTFTVNSGDNLYVVGDITNNGSLIVESGADLIAFESGSITGNNLIVKRNTRYADGKYSFVGTPVQQNATMTVADLGTHVYTYDETQAYGSNDGLDRWITGSGELIPGVGYTQAFQKEIVFEGMPNVGTVHVNGTYTGTYNDATNEDTEGWVLVSNPYTAAIDVADFLAANTNIEGSVYIWDDNGSDTQRGSNSDYIVANGTVATNTTPAGGQTRYNHALGSAQGFFVKLSDDTDTQVSFTADMRVTESNSDDNFFRTTTPSYVRINMTAADGLFKQTIVGWMDEIDNDQVDRRFDARVFSRDAEDLIYTVKADQALAIQGINSFKGSIPMAINVSKAGSYIISMDVSEANGKTLYLKDMQTNEITDLSKDSYTFMATAGQHADRFKLLGNKALLSADATSQLVYVYDKILTIKLNDPQQRKPFQLLNVSGQLVQQMQVEGSATFDLSHLSTGVYLVTDGQTTTRVLVK